MTQLTQQNRNRNKLAVAPLRGKFAGQRTPKLKRLALGNAETANYPQKIDEAAKIVTFNLCCSMVGCHSYVGLRKLLSRLFKKFDTSAGHFAFRTASLQPIRGA